MFQHRQRCCVDFLLGIDPLEECHKNKPNNLSYIIINISKNFNKFKFFFFNTSYASEHSQRFTQTGIENCETISAAITSLFSLFQICILTPKLGELVAFLQTHSPQMAEQSGKAVRGRGKSGI